MPKESIIKHFSSSTTGNVPSSGDLVEGELAINTADEKVFFKNLAGNVVSLGASKDISGAYAAKALPNTFTALQTFSVGISGSGATFSGHISAATKSFVIPHPTVQGMTLRHGSLEGPENGVYVRGHAHGRTVDLPHYWTGLVNESTITVQVTPFGRSQNLYVESVSIHQVVIGGDENPSYFYTVYGERKDVPKLKVEV